MAPLRTQVERRGRTAVVHVRGDVAIPTARTLYGTLRALCRRRDVKKVVLDFGEIGRVDSAGVAVVGIMGRALQRAGKELALDHLNERHAAAFEMAPSTGKVLQPEERQTFLEMLGDRLIATWATLRGLVRLILDTLWQAGAVLMRRRRMPAGSFANHVLSMGYDAVFIVGLLSFLLGMTIAFQGAVQLDRWGAGIFVADMVGVSVVREFAPLMTAIVLTGRTGAAIAAELGTMRVNNEIDALSAMGVSPIRFLIVPRLAALTLVGPALTLMSAFIGIAGGLLVCTMVEGQAATTFWSHVVYRVDIRDWFQCLGKALAFSWIIGFTGAHLGMRAELDAGSVGRATTRTVVVSIFFIIVVDAVFATLISLGEKA